MTAIDPNRRAVTIEWTEALRFESATPEGVKVTFDSAGKAGPGPMHALLMAAGACSGMDVVSILEKMQVALEYCRIEVSGQRAEEHPKRYQEMNLTFRIKGEGLTQAKADRAVELSVTKYCSVMATLDPAMPVGVETVVE